MRAPRPASVLATVALTIAIGGSAYSTAKLTGRDVADASLTGDDIRRGTLDLGHFGDRARTFAAQRAAHQSQVYGLPTPPFGLKRISQPIESGPGFFSDGPGGRLLMVSLLSDRCLQIANVVMTYNRRAIDYHSPPTLKRSGYQGRIYIASIPDRYSTLKATDVKLTGECVRDVVG